MDADEEEDKRDAGGDDMESMGKPDESDVKAGKCDICFR